MTTPTARYFGFNFNALKFQYSNAGTLTEVDALYPNKINIKPDEENIVFEGGGNKRTVYVTTGMTAEFSPDCFNVAAAGVLFGKSNVTTSVPNSGTNLVYFGDVAESTGVSAGIRAIGSAIKNVAGVETNVNLNLWIPLGTLTLAPPGDIETAKKWGAQIFRLGAVRTSVDVAGAALPSVPAGGAFYAIYET